MAVCAARASVVMTVTSFSTAWTICRLMVSASAWLLDSAVRHHNKWTPAALTRIEARTRPEIASRMPMRMVIQNSCRREPAL